MIARDLALGARLTVAGGRDGWVRTLLTVVGVGLGVAMLLAAASIPSMLAERDRRTDARDDLLLVAEPLPAADDTLLIVEADTEYRDARIRGRVVRAEGPRAPAPPGVDRLPGPGEAFASPALKALLDSPDGALLRPRIPERIVGLIADDGLAGPRELAVYRGSEELTGDNARRIDGFGSQQPEEGLDAVLTLLVVIILVTLLLPVAVFVAASVRFGGERRDRRLAALRLVGADAGMTRRVAAGEALVAGLLGLVAGAAFFLLGRRFVGLVEVQGINVFPADVSPAAGLVALVGLGVPVTAVTVSLLALRRVVVEPLGVVRRAGSRRRRMWWRFALPAAGVALLYPLVGGGVGASGRDASWYQVAVGAVLILIGVTAVLPWLVEAVVHRMGGRGVVSWQLALRRLQLDGAAARAVSGIAVAAAGGIALQMLFGAVDDNYQQATGQDPRRADVLVTGGSAGGPADMRAVLGGAAGVRSVLAVGETAAAPPGADTPPGEVLRFAVADCAALREIAAVDGCADGDTFLVGDPAVPSPRPGDRLVVYGATGGDEVREHAWTLPARTRTVQPRTSPVGGERTGVLATPAAVPDDLRRHLRTEAYVTLDPGNPDAHEHLRNAAARLGPGTWVATLNPVLEESRFAGIRRGLYAGVAALLLLIAASLLVTTLEQLRERRRLLAVLVAFGTRRGTLARSVLWQTAVPVALGLAVAAVAGAGLGAILLGMVGEPLRVNWPAIAGISGAGAAVVLLVTALAMPALWRMMRPDGLRTE